MSIPQKSILDGLRGRASRQPERETAPAPKPQKPATALERECVSAGFDATAAAAPFATFRRLLRRERKARGRSEAVKFIARRYPLLHASAIDEHNFDVNAERLLRHGEDQATRERMRPSK